jgi:predicted ribosomally synthesized peptide with SipW-like signal peptide
MDKKILASMLIIAVVAGLVGAGVVSYFSDTETSKRNVFTAGTIDIAVDGENPWTKTYSGFLEDVKPCETRWINFTIKNVGTNEANIWKHIIITGWGGDLGTPPYYGICSSEPEFEEGGGKFDAQGAPIAASYTPKDYLAPWIIYDLYINGQPLITEANQLRLDDIACTYIYLGTLAPGDSMEVCQSYHLMTWADSNVPMITNWAQGDWVSFDIEVIARQLTGPSPEPCVLTLENKDPTTWEPITDGTQGTLKYNLAGHTFDYTFEARGLTPSTSYSLIYYADPWPGNHPGALISTFTTDGTGKIAPTSGSASIGFDLPDPGDKNYPAGAKIWLVPSSGYDATSHALIGWNPTAYLFGMNLIHYDYIP